MSTIQVELFVMWCRWVISTNVTVKNIVRTLFLLPLIEKRMPFFLLATDFNLKAASHFFGLQGFGSLSNAAKG